MKLKVILIYIFCSLITFAQQNVQSEKEYRFGRILIKISQTKGDYNNPCSASFYVYKNDSLLHERNYKNIIAYGGTYGIFVAPNPIIGKYFVLVKHGDYDCRTILIDENGNLIDLDGGYYFLANGGRLLFSDYLQDCNCSFVAYDLVKRKQLYKYEIGLKYDEFNFYKNKNDVYVKCFNSDTAVSIFKYDFRKNILVPVNTNSLAENKLKEINLEPDADDMSQCSCK